MLPRGLRNNNPGNIDYNPRIKWQGQVGIETDLPSGIKPRFAKFSSMEYGVRAIVKLLQTYNKKHGLYTIEGIVNRYAPAHENKTDKYVENVSKWSGIAATARVDLSKKEDALKLIPAIIRQECGRTLDPGIVRRGIDLAYTKPK